MHYYVRMCTLNINHTLAFIPYQNLNLEHIQDLNLNRVQSTSVLFFSTHYVTPLDTVLNSIVIIKQGGCKRTLQLFLGADTMQLNFNCLPLSAAVRHQCWGLFTAQVMVPLVGSKALF